VKKQQFSTQKIWNQNVGCKDQNPSPFVQWKYKSSYCASVISGARRENRFINSKKARRVG